MAGIPASPPAPGSLMAGVTEMDSLEIAVGRALAEVRAARERAIAAEARAVRTDQLLRQFVDGRQDPGELSRRVAELEAENRDLRSRIEKGRDGVDRILASIRFLEDRR